MLGVGLLAVGYLQFSICDPAPGYAAHLTRFPSNNLHPVSSTPLPPFQHLRFHAPRSTLRRLAAPKSDEGGSDIPIPLFVKSPTDTDPDTGIIALNSLPINALQSHLVKIVIPIPRI